MDRRDQQNNQNNGRSSRQQNRRQVLQRQGHFSSTQACLEMVLFDAMRASNAIQRLSRDPSTPVGLRIFLMDKLTEVLDIIQALINIQHEDRARGRNGQPQRNNN